jgi:hypothetical protein
MIEWVLSERWIGKGLELSDRGLTYGPVTDFALTD